MLQKILAIGKKDLPVLLAWSCASLAFVGCSMTGDLTSARNDAASEVAKNNLTGAETRLKQAIDGQEKGDGKDSISLADPLIDLGNIYAKEGKANAAAESFKRASDIQHKDMKPQMLALTKSLNGLGLAYMHQGKFEDSEEVLQQALSIREDNLPAGSKEIAESENSLGQLYF